VTRRYGRTVEDEAATEPLAELPLFRRDDPPTSRGAAGAIEPQLGEIQRAVLAAFREHGAMSARQVEQLPIFQVYGFSTVRKRVSELAAAAYLRAVGTERESGASPCTVYQLRERG